jgi:hypothetical protein
MERINHWFKRGLAGGILRVVALLAFGGDGDY